MVKKVKYDITVNLSAKDLFEFNMYHSYTHSQGIVSIIAGIAAFVLAFTERGKITPGLFAVYIIMGFVILGYIPFTLMMRSRMAAGKGGTFAKPVNITISEESVGIRVGEEENVIPWEEIYCLKDRRNQFLIYTGRITALIIPKRFTSDDVIEHAKQFYRQHSGE